MVSPWVWGAVAAPGAWGWADASGDQLPRARMLQPTPANSRAACWQRLSGCVVIKGVKLRKSDLTGHSAIRLSILVSGWMEHYGA